MHVIGIELDVSLSVRGCLNVLDHGMHVVCCAFELQAACTGTISCVVYRFAAGEVMGRGPYQLPALLRSDESASCQWQDLIGSNSKTRLKALRLSALPRQSSASALLRRDCHT